MYIRFDPKGLIMNILCGAMEEYKPSKEIKEINEKVEKLRKLAIEFNEKVYTPKIEEIQKLIEKYNQKEQSKYKKDE